MTTRLLEMRAKERPAEGDEVMLKSLDKAVSDMDNQLMEALQGQVLATDLMTRAFQEYLDDLEWPNVVLVTAGANVCAGIALYLIWRKIDESASVLEYDRRKKVW